jgi:hypothetical protein
MHEHSNMFGVQHLRCIDDAAANTWRWLPTADLHMIAADRNPWLAPLAGCTPAPGTKVCASAPDMHGQHASDAQAMMCGTVHDEHLAASTSNRTCSSASLRNPGTIAYP